ncbi:hypothetical protein SAMN05192543_10679 [Paraburkholderia megapolitana]|uniref:Uncharacterized protein n=1 Tax=Paraburkholderia megapolitana TaxID=420953 RepID=A0A1I3PUK9_9BURK|nr:hypothetical protein SAMN05192543_10679 [Paraburkholderia megapolitana]
MPVWQTVSSLTHGAALPCLWSCSLPVIDWYSCDDDGDIAVDIPEQAGACAG